MNHTINYDKVIKVNEEGLSSDKKKIEEIREDYSLKGKIKRILIPEKSIKKRISALAKQIIRDYQDSEQLYIIPILKGAFVFAADLGREIIRLGGPELKIDFYEAETYGMEIKKDGEKERKVRILRRPRYIDGVEVILIDDIGDTLQTLKAIREDLTVTLNYKPSNIKVCFLLDKKLKNPPEEIKKLKNSIKPDYVGFEIPDIWIAGYGIDAGEDFRLLSSIVAVREDLY